MCRSFLLQVFVYSRVGRLLVMLAKHSHTEVRNRSIALMRLHVAIVRAVYYTSEITHQAYNCR